MRTWRHILAIGFAFFAVQVIWALYNVFVPLYYAPFVSSKPLIGLLMTVDNWLALALQPLWGARSDHTRTRFGRRLPFLLAGMPLAALGAALLPMLAELSMGALLGGTILLNLGITLFYAPMLALIGDLFPPEVRSRAFGVITMLSALGSVAALLGGSVLAAYGRALPFAAAALCMLAAACVAALTIREPQNPANEPAAEPVQGVLVAALGLVRAAPRGLPLLLLGIFFANLAWGGQHAWWSTYATQVLGLSGAAAAKMASLNASGFLVGAVPAGFLAGRIGRRPTLLLGLGVLALGHLGCAFTLQTSVINLLLLAIGLGWALVLVNALVLCQECAGSQRHGLATGLYAAGFALAQVAAPPIYGLIIQSFGLALLWFSSASVLALAALTVLGVAHSDAANAVAMGSASVSASGKGGRQAAP